MMKYDISWSGGKDSTASIILAREHNIPIRQINYCRIMYNKYIPADLPEMYDFAERAISLFRTWGYKVNILSPEPAVNLIYKKYKNSHYTDRNGKYYGVTAFCRGSCNMTGRKQKILNKEKNISIVGIAADETPRLARLGNNISLLKEYNISQRQTFDICRRYKLLSPLYDLPGFERGGCFFCPNVRKIQIQYIKNNRPDLYKLILSMIEMSQYDISSVGTRNNWVNDYLLNERNK